MGSLVCRLSKLPFWQLVRVDGRSAGKYIDSNSPLKATESSYGSIQLCLESSVIEQSFNTFSLCTALCLEAFFRA